MNSFVKVVLDADPGKLISGFSQADGVVGKFGATLSGAGSLARAASNAFDSAAQHAASIGKKIAAAGVGIETTFVGAGVAAAQFQTNMLNVRTLMDRGFSDRQFKDMSGAVLDMSRKLPQGANDLAKGLYNIVSSGKQGADALRILDVSARAATAGLSTTQNSSTAILAVLNAYGLGANKAKDVSDILFQTVNKGVISFDQLTGVIGDVVGTAAAAHSPIEQVGAAIATMTLSGISADEAGTSLNRVYQSLIDPSESLSGALHALGYESGSTAIAHDGLRGVMEKLRLASRGNIETLMQWFPEIRAARGALALMSDEGRNYARVAGDIEDKQKRAGATNRAFAIQSESAGNAFQRMTNTIHALAIEIGTYLLPPATAFINIVTSIIDAISGMPEPIKQVIAYAGILTGAIMAIGGALLAWKVKNLITQTAINALGRSMVNMSRDTALAGTAFERTGQKLAAQNGPFAITRSLLTLSSSQAGRFGSAMESAGNRLVGFANGVPLVGAATTHLGNGFIAAANGGNIFSSVMDKVKSGALGVVANLGSILTVAALVTGALMGSSQAADEWSQNMMKGLDKMSPTSVINHINKMNDAIDGMIAHNDEVKGSASSFGLQVAKNFGDAALGVVGAKDVIKDSSWDDFFKMNKARGNVEELKKNITNLHANLVAVWRDLHPGAPVKETAKFEAQLGDLARIAGKAGIDLTGTFEKSSGARTKALNEVQRLYAFMGMTGVQAGQVSTEMVAMYDSMAKAANKAGKGAADAFSKSFDLFKSVDPEMTFGKMFGTEDATLAPMAAQISNFYTSSLQKASTFYNGIDEMQRRGANPEVIQKMLQAGPEAAGAVVQAAVEDTTNGVIATLNAGEALLSGFQQRAAAMARLTQQAIMDPTDQKTKDLGLANQVQNEIFKQGSLADVDTVAQALSMDPTSVRKITGEFGITLNDALVSSQLVSKDLKKLYETGQTTTAGSPNSLKMLQSDLFDLYNTITQIGHVGSGEATSLIQRLGDVMAMPAVKPNEIRDKNNAMAELFDTVTALNLAPSEKAFVISVLGAEQAREQIKNTVMLSFPGMTVEQQQGIIDFLLQVRGQPDAIQKVTEFANYLNLTPEQKAVLISAIGTDEAKAKAGEVGAAILALKGANLPITADNIDAVMKAKDADAAVNAIRQKDVPTLTVKDLASGPLSEIQMTLASIQSKEITVSVNKVLNEIQGSQLPASAYGGAAIGHIYKGGTTHMAEGGFTHMAKGGNPMIGDGKKSIIWNEPSTGGESYIPWAWGKRDRAVKILDVTASQFGYDLVKKGYHSFADGGFWNSAAWGGGGGAATVIHVDGSVTYTAPIYGEDAIRTATEDILDKRNRELSANLRRNRTGVN